MRLYLVQHGEAHPENVDPQRRLTDKGIHDTKKVAQFLRPLKLSVEAIWHSGKPRASQTAQILASGVSARQGLVQRDDLNPNDRVAPVRKAIEQSPHDRMIVGHLPFLGKLAAMLVTGNKDSEVLAFRYGGVVCLERADDGSWRLAWMVVPDFLD
ncbi:MAG: phosphohistidine phosphatase SixA [Tepidisphaeraceae bacterium]|jgi:phosphohistidine phosphatase